MKEHGSFIFTDLDHKWNPTMHFSHILYHKHNIVESAQYTPVGGCAHIIFTNEK